MSEPASQPAPTPDAPALKPRRGLLLVMLIAYLIWLAMLILWSVQLHS